MVIRDDQGDWNLIRNFKIGVVAHEAKVHFAMEVSTGCGIVDNLI